MLTNKLIQEVMVKAPLVVAPDLALTEALGCMRDYGVRHLPVVENDLLVGILSERDLKAAMGLSQVATLTVSDVMKRDVYAVRGTMPLRKVLADMADQKFGSAVIVNAKRAAIGIFTTTDALRILSDSSDAGENDFLLDGDDGYESVCWPTYN